MARKSQPSFVTEQEVFPSRLRQLMKETGTTQKALAEVVGVRPQTISLYSTGQSTPDANGLRKIAEFFNVSAGWLIGCVGAVRTIDADVAVAAKLTGLCEQSIDWLSGIKSHKTISESISVQILDALNSLITDYDFPALLIELSKLISMSQQAKKSSEVKGFGEEVEMIEAVDKAQKLIGPYQESYRVVRTTTLTDSMRFKLSFLFNSIVEHIVPDK